MYQIDENVAVRKFSEDDVQELYLLMMSSREHLKVWLNWFHDSYSIEDVLYYIHHSIDVIRRNDGKPTVFAITFQGRIAGTINFHTIDRYNQSASLGYWIGKSYAGKGIMAQTFQFMLKYGFENLSLNRIEVRVAEGNKRSRILPEKNHFTKEGVIREAEWLHNRYVNHVVYGLLKKEWEQLRRKKND